MLIPLTAEISLNWRAGHQLSSHNKDPFLPWTTWVGWTWCLESAGAASRSPSHCFRSSSVSRWKESQTGANFQLMGRNTIPGGHTRLREVWQILIRGISARGRLTGICSSRANCEATARPSINIHVRPLLLFLSCHEGKRRSGGSGTARTGGIVHRPARRRAPRWHNPSPDERESGLFFLGGKPNYDNRVQKYPGRVEATGRT